MELAIRPMRAEDVAAARRVMLTVAAGIFEPDHPAATFVNRHSAAMSDVDDFQNQYSPPTGLFLVATDGGEIVGTGAIRRIDEATAELRRMWLLKAYHGLGIGYRLWRELLAFARSTGFRRIRLTTDLENERARQFYRRLGFDDIERYGSARQGIFMELTIDDDETPKPAGLVQ